MEIGYLKNTHLIKVHIDQVDYEKFSEYLIDDDSWRLNVFSNKSFILEDRDKNGDDSIEDIREDNIESLLNDKFVVLLDHSDLSTFIDVVENEDCIKCDLTKDNNRYIRDMVLKEKERQKYTEEYIEDNLDKDYKFLSPYTLARLPINIFEKYPDKFDWDKISYLTLSKDFILRNKELLNIDLLSLTFFDDDDFLRDHVKDLPKILKDLCSKDLLRDMEINKIIGD